MDDVRDLDATATVRLLDAVVCRRRQAEVDDLRLVLHFADLHSAIAAETTPGGETLGDLGGDGTPGIAELAVVELGVARQVHTHAARSVVADALDLRHRLPHTWAAVQTFGAEVWVARKVARLTRRLSYEAVATVDLAVAEAITGQSPGRVLDLAAGKIIEADRAAHDARIEDERRRRFVGLSRLDPTTGHRSVVARVSDGDAHDVFAEVQRIADLLARRVEYAELSADELRAEAFAWLARPDDVAALADHEPDPRRHRSRAVLYVHLSEAALAGVTGVARVEGLGPHSLTQLTDLLGHRHVTVKPVIDLADRVSVTAYEHPEAMKERIHLIHGGDTFPHGNATGRNLDLDHIASYQRSGPPGQTGSHTSQPLARTGHRAKTHLAYQVAQTATGEVIWVTPHGARRIVDHTGTHVLRETDHDA